MVQSLLFFLRKLTPAWAFKAYHFVLAFLGHAWYGFPSKKLIVFGVTGTKGKTTTAAVLAHILEQAGWKVALSSTAFFQIGDSVETNPYKVSMPGRFILPHFLSKAVKAGCHIAIVESTSEGVLQYRHRFVDYDYFVFTNLRPEHVERHGGFENYKRAKVELVTMITQSQQKRINDRLAGKGLVVNADDKYAGEFWEAVGDRVEKIGVTFHQRSARQPHMSHVTWYTCGWDDKGLRFQDSIFELQVPGPFNASNVALAAAAATLTGMSFEHALRRARNFRGVPGRCELIRKKENIVVVIDYAHEPFSLEEVLKFLKGRYPVPLVHVFGATGGGRDVGKRPVMGEISDRYADRIILTNDDPYDEDPMTIVNAIASGIKNRGKVDIELDRARAIRRALELAETARRNVPPNAEGESCAAVVLISGKGSETIQCFERGRRVPYSDRRVVDSL